MGHASELKLDEASKQATESAVNLWLWGSKEVRDLFHSWAEALPSRFGPNGETGKPRVQEQQTPCDAVWPTRYRAASRSPDWGDGVRAGADLVVSVEHRPSQQPAYPHVSARLA
jgi:hypothetical protein